jgi:hypothetical protein
MTDVEKMEMAEIAGAVVKGALQTYTDFLMPKVSAMATDLTKLTNAVEKLADTPNS